MTGYPNIDLPRRTTPAINREFVLIVAQPMQPFAYCRCRELGAIVGTDVIRWPAQQEQVCERLQYRLLDSSESLSH